MFNGGFYFPETLQLNESFHPAELQLAGGTDIPEALQQMDSEIPPNAAILQQMNEIHQVDTAESAQYVQDWQVYMESGQFPGSFLSEAPLPIPSFDSPIQTAQGAPVAAVFDPMPHEVGEPRYSDWRASNLDVNPLDPWFPYQIAIDAPVPDGFRAVGNESFTIAHILHGLPHAWQQYLDKFSSAQLVNLNCPPQAKQFLESCRALKSLRDLGPAQFKKMLAVAQRKALGVHFVPATLSPALNALAERNEEHACVHEAAHSITASNRAAIHPGELHEFFKDRGYTELWTQSDKSEEVASDVIKRPPNAWILYRQHHHPGIMARNPGLKNVDVSRIIARLWGAEPANVKQVWREKAKVEMKRHQELHPGYRYCPRKSHEKKRRNVRNRKRHALTEEEVKDAVHKIQDQIQGNPE